MSNEELYKLAEDARKLSYSPYSKISVGAALIAKSGKVYTGANIENSSFSPSVCAERVAFYNAISAGEREFIRIAVSGGKSGAVSQKLFFPCGVCRQVMAEFCDKDFKIILSPTKELTLDELLPYSFGKELVL